MKPYRFSIMKWEFRVLPHEAYKLIFGKYEKPDDEVHTVTEYFSTTERIKSLKSEINAINAGNTEGDLASLEAELNKLHEQKTTLGKSVEKIIEKQVKENLAQQGIFNPVDKYTGLRVTFPPVNFSFEKPPYMLVVSPRERIESMREITLLPSISLKEIEDIEAEVDKLGVSSLVVELGGYSIYPSFVSSEASLRFTIDTATEEWLHQYLVFKPLGFLYLLDLIGVRRDYDIATINETLAGMVSEEIGAIIREKHYPGYESDANQNQVAESGFDFNREMREIRKAVDEYLARGEVEQAEEFMEQKRQYLASKGYYIRKLNQAYFAFHGTYADKPAFISPIGLELKQLRSQSASVKDFLSTVATITSRQNLRYKVGKTPEK
ncbi:MAG: hypothetical protein ACETVS_01060 [Dehalococcoidales bacterium]